MKSVTFIFSFIVSLAVSASMTLLSYIGVRLLQLCVADLQATASRDPETRFQQEQEKRVVYPPAA